MNIFKSFTGDSSKPVLGRAEPVEGELNLAYIDMGQGDCTLVSLPDNSLFIIDCGSVGSLPDDTFTETKSKVRKWAKTDDVFVIITHSDRDHYNKFLRLVSGDPDLTIDTIFFSNALSDESPLGNYRQTNIMGNLQKFGYPDLCEITLNAEEHFMRTWTVGDNYKACTVKPIPETGFVIDCEDYSKPGNGAYEISIIAGNVAPTSSSEDKVNVKSLVTLARVGDDKILLTGDATNSTLKYVITAHKEKVRDVTAFQIPHHGSETAEPTAALIKLINPKSIFISVGLTNNGHNLPRYEVIQEWLKCPRLETRPDDQKLTIDSWKYKATDYKNFSALRESALKDWGEGSYGCNKSKSFYWLSNPRDAVTKGTGFYGFSDKSYFLYREYINKNLYMTGTEGSHYEEGFEDSTDQY